MEWEKCHGWGKNKDAFSQKVIAKNCKKNKKIIIILAKVGVLSPPLIKMFSPQCRYGGENSPIKLTYFITRINKE